MNIHVNRNNRKKCLILAAAAAVLLGVAVTAALLPGRPEEQGDFAVDERTDTSAEMKDPAFIQKKVQENADASRMILRINSQIHLKKNGDEALLYLSNVPENPYDLYLELICDESGKTVYKANILKPGDSVEKDRLTGIERSGAQPYTALFHILEDGKEISTVEYAVTVELLGGDE